MKKLTLILAALLTLFFLQYCQSPQKEITPDVGFGKYISAYTSGNISVEAPVLIKLANPVEQDVTPGKEIHGNLFSFNPSIKGKAVWIDKSTLEFVPESPLTSRTLYQAKLKLKDILVTDKGFEEFSFRFNTIKQSFSVSNIGLKTYGGNDFRYMFFNGYILTADVVDSELIENILSANFEKRKVPINWIHESDRRKHYFTIDSLKRGEEMTKNLLLEWNGKNIGVNEKGNQEYSVPALTDFKVLDATVEREPQLCIVVSFSDPLDKSQNLDGLITLEDYENLKFSVEGNRLKVWPGQQLTGQRKLSVHQGIENALNYPIQQDQDFYLVFENIKPQVRLVGKGVIVPHNGHLSMPFEAVSLKTIDLRIVQIYASNIFQFLQNNEPDGDYDLKKVGRLVFSGKVNLKPEYPEQFYKWNTYKVNLADYTELEQGAFYKVEFRFKKAYSLYNCGEENINEGKPDFGTSEEKLALENEQKNWDNPGWYENYFYPDNYNWQERDNACSESYFNSSHFVSRNIFTSTLGIIAKEGKGHNLTFVITNRRQQNLSRESTFRFMIIRIN